MELKGHHLALIVVGVLGVLCVLLGATIVLYIAFMNQTLQNFAPPALDEPIQAQIEMDDIEVAIDLFHADLGRYPASLDELKQAPEDAPGWSGPYHHDDLLDPWGNRYDYALADEPDADPPYVLRSLGADGIEGGVDADEDLDSKDF